MKADNRSRETWTKTLLAPEDPAGATVVRLDRAAPRLDATPALKQFARLNLRMALTDVLAVILGLVLADVLRGGGLQVPRVGRLILYGVVPAVVVPVFAALRLYATYQLAPAEEFRRILQAVTVSLASLFAVSFWTHAVGSRAWFALSLVLATIFALGARKFWHWFLWKQRQRGRFLFRTLIVGSRDEARRLAEILRVRDVGYRPIGFVVVDEQGKGANGGVSVRLRGTDLPVLGGIGDLRDVVVETSAECLFVASTEVRPTSMAYLAEIARLERLELRASSNFPEVLTHRLAVQPVGGVMALSLKPATLTRLQAIAKRLFDIVVASTILLLTLPVTLIAAALIRSTSRGPVLFRQERVGLRGRPFTLLKFRTMVRNAELLLPDLEEQNELGGPLFKLRDDPRVTRVGRWLRRWSLDELPQLVNVVRGEMSLVGPRPALPSEAREFDQRTLERLEVPPGVTGLWQVRGRSDVSFEEYVRLDLFYVENWSLSFDVWILLKTARAVLSRRGAY